jgi:O-antigen/teichoic acid export membrane protein
MAAAGFTTAGTVFTQAFNFGASIVLTRLLMPTDFGLLAMVTVVTGFARVLSDFGMSSALVQARAPEEREFSSAFWANIGLGLVLSVLLAGSAPLLAGFYRDTRVGTVMLVLSGQFLITSLGSVHSSRLQRRMAFGALVISEVISVVLGSVTAMVAAGLGAGVWSLVLRAHVQSLALVCGLWTAERWLPDLRFDFSALKHFLRFSLSLTGSRVINYWIRNLDNVLIARFFGAGEVGLYVRGYSVLMQPVSMVTTSLGRVMFPTFASIQDDLPRTRSAYRRTLQLIALVTFPSMALLSVSADDFVLGLFGPTWLGCVSVIRIFCVLGALQSLGTTAGWIFQARGRADLQLKWTIAAAVVMVASILTGVWWGSIEAVALCTCIGSGGILLIPAFEVPGRLIGVSFLQVVGYVLGTLGCTAVAVLVAIGVRHLPFLSPGLVRLAAVWLTGSAVYLGLARATRQPALTDLQAQLGGLLKRFRKR